jgi:hypothetical protein
VHRLPNFVFCNNDLWPDRRKIRLLEDLPIESLHIEREEIHASVGEMAPQQSIERLALDTEFITDPTFEVDPLVRTTEPGLLTGSATDPTS